MTEVRAPLRFALWLLATAACGKGVSSNAAAALDAGEALFAQEPMGAREADAWTHAKEGDDEDRMRLADLVGGGGLRERADDARLRSTAIRAMAFCSDFSELPWLSGIATESGDPDGALALETVVEQAARPRRATDPEDAVELAEGCRALLALARSPGAPQTRRVMAIRALRMLSDRGCVNAAEIPADFDAK